MAAQLENKIAIVYGAAGGLGAGIARAFAAEGAHVVLAGRTEATLANVEDTIRAAGGSAEVAVVDATDEAAVDAHAAAVVAKHGRIDISFNLVSRGDVQGTPIVDMSLDDLMRAPTTWLRAQFLTVRAAVRQMRTQGSGVVLHLNSGSADGAYPGMGSTGPADAAVESLLRYVAAENGRNGVRVVGLWTAGVAETLTDEGIAQVDAGGPTGAEAQEMIAGISILGRAPRLSDVTGAAVFLASDHASGITGTMVNVTAGLTVR